MDWYIHIILIVIAHVAIIRPLLRRIVVKIGSDVFIIWERERRMELYISRMQELSDELDRLIDNLDRCDMEPREDALRCDLDPVIGQAIRREYVELTQGAPEHGLEYNFEKALDLDDLMNAHCPVCGYYCLGRGGAGCIDKPELARIRSAWLDSSAGWIRA